MDQPVVAVGHVVNGIDRATGLQRLEIGHNAGAVVLGRDDLVEKTAAAIDHAVHLGDHGAVEADLETRRVTFADHVEEAQARRHPCQVLGFDRLPLRNAAGALVALPEFEQPTMIDRPDNVRPRRFEVHR